jgi:hypothetical protein
MKSDIEVYGIVYSGELGDPEKEFLTGLGVDVTRKPWARARSTRRGPG